jgi:hypothetical protein
MPGTIEKLLPDTFGAKSCSDGSALTLSRIVRQELLQNPANSIGSVTLDCVYTVRVILSV